jgi:hypothetical protein
MKELVINMLGLSDIRVLEDFYNLAKKYGRAYRRQETNYIWVKGNMPLCFVAHVDTVCPIKTNAGKFFREHNGVITAYQKTSKSEKRLILGADDRAGCAVLYDLLLNSINYKKFPHFLLLNYEECGALGAREFVKGIPDLTMIHLFIELDRHGANHYVQYNNNPNTVHKFMEKFGIKFEGRGSFSDIRVITEYSSIPSINLATGYYSEHTCDEFLDLNVLHLLHKKVKRIIEQFPTVPFGQVTPEVKIEYIGGTRWVDATKFKTGYIPASEPIVSIPENEYYPAIVCNTCGEDEADCLCKPSRQQLMYDYRKIHPYAKVIGGTF